MVKTIILGLNYTLIGFHIAFVNHPGVYLVADATCFGCTAYQ